MNTQIGMLNTDMNVGTIDRVIRFFVGGALIAIPLLDPDVNKAYLILTVFAAIPVIFTAITRWDPIYASFANRHAKQGKAYSYYQDNLGDQDRMIRLLIGIFMIGVTMGFTSVSSSWAVYFALTAIPVVTTVIMRWDPIYALFQINSIKSHAVPVLAKVIKMPRIANVAEPLPPSHSNHLKAA